MLSKIKERLSKLSPDEIRKLKFYSIVSILFALLIYVVYVFMYQGENKEITEMEIPDPKKIEEYNNKLNAISSQKTVTYEEDLEQYFNKASVLSAQDSVNLSLKIDIFSEHKKKEDIYDNEDVQIDSLMKVFEKQNTAQVTKKNTSTYQPKKTNGTTPNYQINNTSEVSTLKAEKSQPQKLTKEEEREVLRKKRLDELRGTLHSSKNNNPKTISASIRGNQVLKNGQLLKLITNTEFSINGFIVPVNTYLYGTVNFSNNKANVSINSINVNNQVLHCKISVYSANGTSGIDIDIDNNINKGKNTAISEGEQEISGSYGRAVGIVTSVLKGKAQETKVTFTDNQKVLLMGI